MLPGPIGCPDIIFLIYPPCLFDTAGRMNEKYGVKF